MLGSLGQLGAKALGARFLLVSLLPGALVFLVLAGLLRTHAYSAQLDLDNLLSGYSDKSASALAFFAGILLAGLLLQPFQVWIVQRLEGYWGSRGLSRVLAEMRVEHHIRRKELGELLQFVDDPQAPSTKLADVSSPRVRPVAMIDSGRLRAC